MGGSNIHMYVWTVFIFIFNFVLTEALLCYDCQNMPHPRDCGRIAECNANEECIVQSIDTVSGNIFYNSGCASKVKCDAGPNFGRRRSVYADDLTSWDHQLDKRSDIILCVECCNKTNYCNRNLCDPDKPTKNRTTCLDCPNVESPEKCEFTSLCDVGEVCYTEVIRLNGEDRYRLGCVNPKNCALTPPSASVNIVGKKRFLVQNVAQARLGASYCGKCCKDSVDNCNRDLCRTGVTLPPSTHAGPLTISPPQRECEDVDTETCKAHLIRDPDLCLNNTISSYACCRTCAIATGTITPGGSGTVERLPKTDCFYESTRYAGAYRYTRSGVPCISWETANQQKAITGPGFPETNIIDAENKCRDPTGRGHPWCYSDVFLDWDFCPVPYCAECFYKGNSNQYNGYVSKDQNNNTCLPWTSSNNTLLTDSMFSDRSIVNASNHCRDVFGIGLYCYTATGNNPCNIPECPGKCEDDPKTNCSLIKDFVCPKEYIRKTLCPKTCGDCSFGLMPPRLVPPPECKDQVAACPYLKDTICKNITAAKEVCPRTCNVGCAATTSPGVSTIATTPSTIAPATTSPGVSTIATTPSTIAPTKTTTLPSTTVVKTTVAKSTPVSTTHVTMTTPTTPNPNSWTSWGGWLCETQANGRCFATRRRNCSTGVNTDCTGKHIEVVLCNLTICAGQCIDDPAFVCLNDNPDIQLLICDDPSVGKLKCPRKCGYCCEDVFNCTSQGTQSFFCSDDTLARKYCKKSCNKCDSKTIAVTKNQCNDPVLQDMCPTLERELCICEDPEIRMLCQHFCAGQCVIKPSLTEECRNRQISQGKRSEILRRTLEHFYDTL